MNANLQIKKQLKEISNEEANSSCFDCGNKPANWASISNGIFLCLDCSSEHRGYGIEISFIRSITMDQWTQEQVNIMKIGGNQRLKDFLTNYEIPENMDRKIIYFSNLMNFYRKQIKAESMGQINMEPFASKEVFWNQINSYDRNNFNNNIKDNENKNKNEIIIEVDQYQLARNKLNILSEQSEEINNIKENVSDNKERYISIGSEQNNTNNNNNSYL
jgi:ribosomal protein L37AE/L43A